MENGQDETDVGFAKDPIPAGMILQNLGARGGGDEPKTEQEEEEEGSREDEEVPAELQSTYYFGCGPYYSKQLHWLMARKKVFTFLLCCYAFIQGAIVSGKYMGL